MKANNLHGEYCQSCAAILDEVQRHHRRVVVLDSQCAAVFNQSGDAARLDEIQKNEAPMVEQHARHVAPEIPAQKHKQETAQVQETVHTKSTAKARRGAH